MKYFRDVSRRTLANGVDQIHTLLFSDNKIASIDSIPSQFVDVDFDTTVSFSCSTFTLRDSGPNRENHSLRYDLKIIDPISGAPKYIPNGRMNRKSGVFSIRSSDIPVGEHKVKVYLTDGKGGMASRSFILIGN